MWRTEITHSAKQYFAITLFYTIFSVLLMVGFADTYLDCLTSICVICTAFQWWQGWIYCKTIRGELAIFYDIKELYFARQRWSIVKRPLFLRYAIIINITSKRNGKRRILFLMDDSFSCDDWRSLNYILRQLIAI